MPNNYRIENQKGTYFLTFQVVDWIDVFTRKNYCKIILDSFDYCRRRKGLKIHAYVIMSNHVHSILSATDGNLSELIRDFKSYTSKRILSSVNDRTESRRHWMLQRFKLHAKSHQRNITYQFWTHQNHAIELVSEEFLRQKMAYIHLNPVRAGYVDNVNHWIYSSQRNYSELDSLIEIDLLDI